MARGWVCEERSAVVVGFVALYDTVWESVEGCKVGIDK